MVDGRHDSEAGEKRENTKPFPEMVVEDIPGHKMETSSVK